MQTVNRVGSGALVESCFFQSGANQNSSITAWHQVNLGSANHVTHDVVPGAGYSEHLPFDRAGREAMGGETSRPRARAIHHAGCAVVGSIRANARNSAVRNEHIGDSHAGRNIHSAM